MNAYQANNFLPRDGELTEFSNPIKKGGYSATQFNQFFDLTPKRSNSFRQAALTHELKGSLPITESICSSKSSSKRIVLLVLFERSYGFLSFSSCIGSNHYDSLLIYGANQYKGKCYKKTMPRSGGTLTGHLTTSDTQTIEVAMRDHITPLTGRNSHTQNIVFIWRFAECQQNKATYHLVITHTENEARSMLPNLSLVFTARIRVGVNHA